MRRLTTCLYVCLTITLPLMARPLVIVEDGESRAVIITAKDEPQALEAAREIQLYVEKMSGAKLPLLTEGDSTKGNEAWVWVNGECAGHKPHKIWWMGSHDLDVDVTKLVRPGKRNTIAIRVLNTSEPGGLYRRGFFWSPKENIKE